MPVVPGIDVGSLYRSVSPGGRYNASFSTTPTWSATYGGIAAPYTPTAAPTYNSGGDTPGTTSVIPAPSTQGMPFNIGDYGDDPIVGKVRAAVEAQNAEAEQNALAAKRTQLVRFGDPALLQSVLGKNAGDATQAAANNPFSTVHDLNTWNARSLTGIDETRNAQNLFYSSTRARDRSLQEESMLRAKAQASGQVQDVINNIQQDVINVRNQGLQQIIAAEEQAYQRQVERALAQAQMAAYANATAGAGGGGTVTTDGGGGGGGGAGTTNGPQYDNYVVDQSTGNVIGINYTPTRTSGLVE